MFSSEYFLENIFPKISFKTYQSFLNSVGCEVPLESLEFFNDVLTTVHHLSDCLLAGSNDILFLRMNDIWGIGGTSSNHFCTAWHFALGHCMLSIYDLTTNSQLQQATDAQEVWFPKGTEAVWLGGRRANVHKINIGDWLAVAAVLTFGHEVVLLSR